MPVTSPLRLTRAAIFAVACCGLGALAHLLAGGSLTPAALAGGLAVGFGAAIMLSGRERTFGVILGLLIAVQIVLHLMFAMAAQGATPAIGGHFGHSGLVPGLSMLIMHGWAIVLTSWCLARGEAALWALLRRLAVRLMLILIAPADPPFPPLSSVRADELELPRSVLLRDSVSRRGPPRPVTAAMV